MAKRPVFISTDDLNALVKEVEIEFKWFPGMSKSQKQKSIQSLHNAIMDKKDSLNIKKVLEVSSKSEDELGVALSAFNLSFPTYKGKSVSVECIFQASKVFEKGGPYIEILNMTSLQAKKYEKLQTSGKLLSFERKGERWDLEPKTLFYDWIYLNTLRANKDIAKEVLQYNAFTDIEFNPKKSINCQAASVALFVALSKAGILDDVLKNKEAFTSFLSKQNTRSNSKLL